MNPSPDFTFTQSEKMEIALALKRVALRENISVNVAREKFENETRAMKQELSADNPSAAKKKILLALRENSEPVKAAYKKQFEEKCGALRKKIPGLAKIETHPDFEKNWIEISFRVKNEWELKVFLEKLSERAQEFDALLRFLRGEEYEAI